MSSSSHQNKPPQTERKMKLDRVAKAPPRPRKNAHHETKQQGSKMPCECAHAHEKSPSTRVHSMGEVIDVLNQIQEERKQTQRQQPTLALAVRESSTPHVA